MEDSIFTKIIKGEIPCHKIYEDEATFAFLDIAPDEVGHTLLVPKQQVDKIYDLDDETYSHLWLVAKKIARHYQATTGKRVIFHVIGVDVPHAHIHIVPYDPANHTGDAEHMAAKPQADPEELAATAEKLRIDD